MARIRHISWNNPDILTRLTEEGVGFCNVDQPKLGRSLSGTHHATSPVGYVRLHGRNFKEWFASDNRNDRYNYLYKQNELENWVERIESVQKNAQKTFVATNNHPDGKAAVNGHEIKNMLDHEKVKAPQLLVNRYPENLREISILTSPEKTSLLSQNGSKKERLPFFEELTNPNKV